MGGGALDGDRIVAVAGVIMAMVLVSRSTRLRNLPWRRRWALGAIWAAIFVGVAVVAAMFGTRGSS